MQKIREFDDYRDLLQDLVDTARRSGIKTKIAGVLGCHPSYLTRVLNKEAHLSQEQGLRLCHFVGYSDLDQEYFIACLNLNRAGSKELIEFYEKKIAQLARRATDLAGRMPQNFQIPENDRITYHSHWSYAAVHVAASMRNCQSVDTIANYLGLDLAEVSKIVTFLVRCGLLERNENSVAIKATAAHLEKTSRFIRQHHLSWRARAIQSIDRLEEGDLHYSGTFTISSKHKRILQKKMADFLEELGEIVIDSDEEHCLGFCVDIFDLHSSSR